MIPFRGINNPGSGGGPGPGGQDIRGPRVVVGNGPNGDLANDCDILDSGNGAAVATALAFVGGLGLGGDVWVRNGLYDLAAAGAPAVPLAIPTLCTLRGASTEAVFSAKIVGDLRVFTLGSHSNLYSVGVNVPAPTAIPFVPPIVPQALIDCLSDFHTIDEIDYHFDQAITAAEFQTLFMSYQAMIQTSPANVRSVIKNLNARFFQNSSAPSGLLLGVAQRFTMIGCAPSGVVGTNVGIGGSILVGGDTGINTDITSFISNCGIVPVERGVRIGATAQVTQVLGTAINCTAGSTPGLGASCVGVEIDATERVRLEGNYISAATSQDPVAGSRGIWFTNTALDGIADGNHVNDFDTGILIDFASPTHVITSNRIPLFGVANIIDNDGTSLVANNL